MIKPNELRMGNLVYDDEGIVVKIESLRSKEFNDWNGSDEGQTLFSKNDELCWSSPVFGIPLTPDWLDRFGFSKSDDPYGGYLVPVTETTRMRVLWDEVNFYHDAGFYKPTLEHVHQLQNLYHALTGQELELKEKL